MQKPFPETGAAPNYPISSVDNALRLLLLFREHRAVRLTEACQYLGVAHSTAHRLLAMLTYHGFVRQEAGSRVYVAGPALVDVGLAVVEALDIRAQARPFLDDLTATFGETSHLSVLEGAMVRYLDAVESDKALRVVARTGALIPAHCTSLGKAMLAHLTEEEMLQTYPLGEPLTAMTDESITSREVLVRELAQVRRTGFAVNLGESEEGVGSVAIAFRDVSRKLASIAIAAPTSRLDDQRIALMASALQEVADRFGAAPSVAPIRGRSEAAALLES